MSYEARIDQMVGQYVADFQRELALAKTMRECIDKPCAMPYGYPLRVWCPRHICRCHRARPFVPRGAGKLSNGVPRILRLWLSDGYALGLYNPPPGDHRR